MPTGACGLCRRTAELQNSHSIPRFVLDWLKKTGATPYLRQAIAPNLRRQDFGARPFLCAECEGRFNRWETLFAAKIFHPFQNGEKAYEYGEWLRPFMISLAWRSLTMLPLAATHDVPECGPLADSLKPVVETAAETWRGFLLDESDDAGPYEHHMFFVDYIAEASGRPMPAGFHLYLLRSVDATLAHSSRSAAAYVKLPGIICWSAIEPPTAAGFSGTLVSDRGRLEPPQVVKQPGFGDFLLDRARMAMRLMDTMSPTQRKAIQETYLRQPDRVAASRTLKAQIADLWWSDPSRSGEVKEDKPPS